MEKTNKKQTPPPSELFNLIDPMQQFNDAVMRSLTPYQKGVKKALEKAGEQQTIEALSQGVPAEHIETGSGLNVGQQALKELLQTTNPRNNDLPALKQPEGLFGKLFGQSKIITDEMGQPSGIQQGGIFDLGYPQADLKALLKINELRQAPLETQAEQRRLAGEERRAKQAERESIRQFGRSVGETEIPQLLNDYGVDVNTMVETYGIPAQIDKETGERRWNLPDMYTQSTMAKNKPTTPEERKYMGDIFNAVDTTQEILADLKDLGIEDPSQIGDFKIPEGFWSDMGPTSIPARFNLAGQYAKDPKYSALKSKIERMFQQYKIVITGAQASDKELKALRPLIISMTQRPGVFFATANDLVNESTRNADTRLQLMESAGRDTSKIREMLDTKKGASQSSKTQQGSPQPKQQKSYKNLWE